MVIDAETYRVAASEHATVAVELYQLDRYVMAHYAAGLAVECIFRAYRVRIDPEFDSRHDLRSLYKLARFEEVVPKKRIEVISAALGVVLAQWSNDHRFRSEDALRKRFVQLGLYQGIKGDFMKERTRRIVNAAMDIVSTGAQRWKN